MSCKFNANVQNIPPSFHTRVTRSETASPLSDSCSDVCAWYSSAESPTPELADVSTHRYSLCASGTPSLAWCFIKNSQQDLSPVSSELRHYKSRGINPVSVHTAARNSLNDVMCYVTSGKGLTPVVSM